MSLEHKTLIHTALLCEATPFIQELKLKKISKNLYENGNFILLVSGIGQENTTKSLSKIFENQKIKKALNVGIAACSDTNVKIGTLFCVSCKLPNMLYANIKTHDKPLESKENLKETLHDMEFESFFHICKNYKIEKTFSFKVVSDYCECQIPKKDFVTKLIYENLPKIKEYL